MESFEEMKIKYLDKIEQNPEIINRLILENSNSEDGKKALVILLNPKNEKELFLAETLYTMAYDFLLLVERINHDEIPEIQNSENRALHLYIMIIRALKNNNEEYAKLITKNISSDESARIMYDFFVSFMLDANNCVEYIAEESYFDLAVENQLMKFIYYFEKAQTIMDEINSTKKNISNYTVEDFKRVKEFTIEFDRLCKEEKKCIIR